MAITNKTIQKTEEKKTKRKSLSHSLVDGKLILSDNGMHEVGLQVWSILT